MHLSAIRTTDARTPGCEECVARGMAWVHLRRCVSCGHVGCCDSSVGRHATAHHHITGHPIIQSYEPNEEWLWCYPQTLLFELPATMPSASHP